MVRECVGRMELYGRHDIGLSTTSVRTNIYTTRGRRVQQEVCTLWLQIEYTI